MRRPVALFLVLLARGIAGLFLANYQSWELRFELNERLPTKQKFESLFWTFVTHLEFRRPAGGIIGFSAFLLPARR
jgi:hypothetical protein